MRRVRLVRRVRLGERKSLQRQKRTAADVGRARSRTCTPDLEHRRQCVCSCSRAESPDVTGHNSVLFRDLLRHTTALHISLPMVNRRRSVDCRPAYTYWRRRDFRCHTLSSVPRPLDEITQGRLTTIHFYKNDVISVAYNLQRLVAGTCSKIRRTVAELYNLEA